MYLSQGLSTLLFTAIRLTLQIASIHLISHIASRQLNITYQERINGSLLRGVKYILFTKFQPEQKHYLGRVYVALALITALALNYLPTLLVNLYPVRDVFLPDSKQELDIGPVYARTTTNIQPGETSVENLLFRIGVPLNGSIFSQYTVPIPSQTPCNFNQSDTEWIMHCGNETIEFSRTYISAKQSFYYRGNDVRRGAILNGTTQDGVAFKYFSVPTPNGPSPIADMYMNLAQATNNELYSDMMYRGASNTEECFTNISSGRCIRQSHGYLLSVETGHIFIITRRAFLIQRTFLRTKPLSQKEQTIVNPVLNITLDCKQLPTVTLERMCKQLSGLDPEVGETLTIQQLARGPGSTIQWDVVNTQLLFQSNPNGDEWVEIALVAFHLDINVAFYNSKYKYPNVKDYLFQQDTRVYLKLRGQEIFETTKTVDNTEGLYDHSWVQYGFSDDDLYNMTSFILRGTMQNSGTILLHTPASLANISGVVVALLFMAALIMIICGFVASKDVPSLTRDPITEVLSQTLLPNQGSPVTKEKNMLMYYLKIAGNNFRRRRVTNLTLKPEYPMEDKDQEDNEERIDNDTAVASATANITATTKPLTYRLCISFEEKDRERSSQLVTDDIAYRPDQSSESIPLNLDVTH